MPIPSVLSYLDRPVVTTDAFADCCLPYGVYDSDDEQLVGPRDAAHVLPEFCQHIYSIDERILQSVLALSVAVDSFCRSIDTMVDDPKCRMSDSAHIQLAFLKLMRAISQIQEITGLNLAHQLERFMGRASDAERFLWTINSREGWVLHRSAMGEKNASLLIVPFLFSSLSKDSRWNDQMDQAMIGLFTVMQMIDDLIDAEDDARSRRYTYYWSHLTATAQEMRKESISNHIVPKSYLSEIVVILDSLRGISSLSTHPHITATRDFASELLAKVDEDARYSEIRRYTVKHITPVCAY